MNRPAPLVDAPATIEDQVRLLRTALSVRHERMYAFNAPFHAAVNTLCNLLPMWVDGLVAQAEVDAADVERKIAEMMAAPNPNARPLT